MSSQQTFDSYSHIHKFEFVDSFDSYSYIYLICFIYDLNVSTNTNRMNLQTRIERVVNPRRRLYSYTGNSHKLKNRYTQCAKTVIQQ